jgi:phenylacetate-CoA ligase
MPTHVGGWYGVIMPPSSLSSFVGPAAPNPLGTLKAIRHHPHASKEDLVRFQSARLRRLIRHAYERVPYYRRLFDEHGISPEAIRAPSDLALVPVTTRKTLQSLSAEEIVARGVNPARLTLHSTSGSAGRPIQIRRSWVEDRLLAAIRIRAMRSFGLTSSDEVAIVKTVLGHHAAGAGVLQYLLRTLRKDRWKSVDCMLAPEALARRLHELRPTVVTGYPGHLARLAQTVDQSVLRALRLRFICTGGEVLTGVQRSRIAEAFGAPVYDSYGSYEFDLLAWECPRTDGYHVSDDGMILEIVRDGRPAATGERGETVGTCLHSYAMPFIRYALGDFVERGPDSCPCGQPFSTIREIRGRMIDFFELPGGRLIHPYEVFIPIRERSPWMRQYQVTQRAADDILMRVVAESMPPEDALARVRTMAAAHFGPGVRFEVEVVSDIAPEPSGKFQTYRSLVRSEYDGLR